jgi:DNA-binding NtrC family response regulator
MKTKIKTDSARPFEFTALLVDDDDKFRTQLAKHLRDDGVQIVEANSSSQACESIRKGKISIVLLDWDLQNHNFSAEEPTTGLEILRTCHALDPLLPIIVMSGAGLFDSRADSLNAGADGFLKKPIANELVGALLRRWEARLKAEKNPFTRLTAGVIEPVDAVNRAYARAVVEKVGSALRAAPKLGLSRQTVSAYLASAGVS